MERTNIAMNQGGSYFGVFSGGLEVEYNFPRSSRRVNGPLSSQIRKASDVLGRTYLEFDCVVVLGLDKVHNEAAAWHLGWSVEYRYGNLTTAPSQREPGLIIKGRTIAAMTCWKLQDERVEQADGW